MKVVGAYPPPVGQLLQLVALFCQQTSFLKTICPVASFIKQLKLKDKIKHRLMSARVPYRGYSLTGVLIIIIREVQEIADSQHDRLNE